MEQKGKFFKWLSIILLGAGFLTYVVYLFCRKPAGIAGTEHEHIGWFVIDVFMIGGAILGLLMPKRFGKLAGFSIIGLSFANLVMNAVNYTGSVFLLNDSKISDKFIIWINVFTGFISLAAIVFLILSLVLPKLAKIFGPAAAIAFAITGLLLLTLAIHVFTGNSQSWAYGINDIAVSLITLGLAAGLVVYAWLLKPEVCEKQPDAQ